MCHTSGVSKDTAYDDMVFIKYLFCQTDGRQYLHWILSHDKGVHVDVVNFVAEEVLLLVGEKYQVIAATHTNTQNLHTHFLINPVDITTGKKFSESTKDMLKFRSKINAILKDCGLNECGSVESVSEERIDLEECELEERNVPGTCIYEEGFAFQTFQLYQNQFFGGKGIVEDGNVLIPGVVYEMEQTQESKTEVAQYENGHVYKGRGYWENGRFLVPGILYEEVEP